MVVGGFEPETTQGGAGEVGPAVWAHHRHVRDRIALQPQPGHSAIRVDVETDLFDAIGKSDLEGRHGVTGQRRRGDDLHPLAATGRRVQRELLGVVAREMRRVDGGQMNPTGYAQSQDTPVVTRFASAAGLPAVHPLAAIGVLVIRHRRARRHQVGRGSEELVIAFDDAATHALGEEIDHLRRSILAGAPTTVSTTRPRKRIPSYGLSG